MRDLAVLEGFDRGHFLANHWGRSPCLIRDWLRPDAVELGTMLRLAQGNELPTRRIEGSLEAEDWRVVHGPVEAGEVPAQERNWTILVQEMDKVDAEVASILDAFRFLPHWILDDVMISQAAPGGSVGPHEDAYDVFLVQVEGSRRWELSARENLKTDDRFELALIANWAADLIVDTEPGDVLYLPPGIGHHGVAQTPCQTWSVGLRTPSGPELMFQLAETLLEDPDFSARLQVDVANPERPDQIGGALIKQVRQLLSRALELDDDQLGPLLASFLTRWRLWPGDEQIELGVITRQLRASHPVRLAATARLALLGKDQLYVNGERIDCPRHLALELSRDRCFSAEWLDHDAALEVLLELGAIARPRGPSAVS